MLDTKHIKSNFPILKTKSNGYSLVYLDNASTTQKPKAVIESISNFYRKDNANVHRGVYSLSEQATAKYEEAKEKVVRFIGAKDAKEIIFTKNATEGLNLLAFSLGKTFLKKGDVVLVSGGEHHSNLVPWQLASQIFGFTVEAVKMTVEGRWDLGDFQNKIKTLPVKIVSVAHASNSSGVIHPVEKIVPWIREKKALLILDGAQSVPHMPVSVARLGCDFLVFSGHKMLGPTGIGVVWGKKDLLLQMEPYQGGGGMIREVHLTESTWADVPERFEAGTPPIAEAVALGVAVDYLSAIGMGAVFEHEKQLTEYALGEIQKISGVEIYGPMDMISRGGIISFGIRGVHPHDIATICDTFGIAIRAGHHCSQSMMGVWKTEATARVSFYIYNTEKDVDELIKAIGKVKRVFQIKN
ncbi:MAG: cysteine desulfurase / selenocysteine lyase [Parcubacteria group bacterium Gr01-1014_18]|nr:MAG: cysteine desulfurase / selenocysteine lyase [Parcubacteria group bacterium Greene0416_36]TSC80708.1 MAG: cysteine desulfurase / selenocysteine lyase [Parcubacteria group bacterium Gr01-1014_18]TSC98681.1 MAG: cysteine desulfurase / selenocysteine lyase [Parcubacteria group bacterium Greene1014_20]TSD07159.1 MAG: cysteine desulfurase / selenocysteine lyase [Parcubacteria group bacterium Greene0714_2]